MGLLDYSPWVYVCSAVLLVAVLWLVLRKRKTTETPASYQILPDPPRTKSLSAPISAVLSLIDEPPTDSWETIKSSPELSIYRKKTGDSPVAIVKATALINEVSAEDIMQVIWDVHVRASWDSVMKGFQEVEVHSADSSVITFFVKPPVPFVAARDFVQLRCRERVGNAIVIAYQSVDRPDVPLADRYIRGNTIISGYRIEQKSPNQCEVAFISQTDIKGLIPVPLLNSIAPLRVADWIKKMSLAAQRLGQQDLKTQ
jgi:hypothetical protein